ncbi:hypothetical protein AUK40_00930 [Candidatus Wirthbacteria bacterium CG2_30_54_11]|uniref:HAD family hydrolase n=1 Tax=Candidatus Wirthbacteria bacterium CG2_30_54_11 TaxID=1817892 RepID=A0A1J5IXI7_9BACT|nr:MAG: hypothetical protein AUK40_00930 [Candidatus Wirthbacteria bacterium CG2_30_54_11]
MSTKKNLIVVDFDWTIFDLRILTEAMEASLGAYGLSPELFKATFAQAKDNPEGYYDRETHISAILQKAGRVEDELRTEIMGDWADLVTDLSASAFDAVEFVSFKMALPGCEVVILTYGEQIFQKSKVDASGVGEMVSSVFFTSALDGKEQRLREFLDRYERVVSINDAVEPNDSFLRTFKPEVEAGRFLILEMQREYKNAAKKRAVPIDGIVPVIDLGEGTVQVIRDFLDQRSK